MEFCSLRFAGEAGALGMERRTRCMSEEVDMEITSEGNTSVVVFKSATISNTEQITSVSKRIKEFIDKNRPDRVIFDFGEVKFFSSLMLGLLLETRSKLQPYNGEVTISKINPQLYRVFRITNLDKVFRFFPDKQSALEAMSVD
jgi:anti-sigma B factor antagonist